MHAAERHGTPAQIRRAIWATRGLFTVLGVFSAVWGVHIPSVKRQYDLRRGSALAGAGRSRAGGNCSIVLRGPGDWPAGRAQMLQRLVRW